MKIKARQTTTTRKEKDKNGEMTEEGISGKKIAAMDKTHEK